VSDDERTAGDTLELPVVVVSVLLVVSTLGYVGWQATTTAETADPTASVVAVEPTAGEDRVRVEVRLTNRRETGLARAQVGVRCGDTHRSLTFEHVPVAGDTTGSVVCPAGTEPTVQVETWVTA
jgi:hypothetical protein